MLSENFGLDKSTVKTAESNQYKMYEIYFNDSNAAETFEKTMSAAKCFPNYFKFSNSVQLNERLKDEIIEAAARQKAISSPPIEHPEKKSLAIEGMPEKNPDTVANEKYSDNNSGAVIENTSEINPFDLQWLSDNFGLDSATVISAELDKYGMYGIHFEDSNAAEKFAKTMREAGCLFLLRSSNSIEFSVRHPESRIRIIEAATVRQKNPDNEQKRPAHQAITLFFAKAAGDERLEPAIKSLSRYLKLAPSAENDIEFIGCWMYACDLLPPLSRKRL